MTGGRLVNGSTWKTKARPVSDENSLMPIYAIFHINERERVVDIT
jgi:hypothetical protein